MQKLGLNIKENEPLANHTTFKVGGPARYFVEVDNKADLEKSILFAKNNNLPFFILGGGSNVLVADHGYNGLVIKVFSDQVDISGTRVRVFAGAVLAVVARRAIEAGLTGLEFAANIPGTIGGAVRGNAGAYGKGVGDLVDKVHVIDAGVGDLGAVVFTKKQCDFSYRDSIFKINKNKIITEVELVLEKSDRPADEILQEVAEEGNKRAKEQPWDYPSAGSVFKNIELSSRPTAVGRSGGTLSDTVSSLVTHGKIPAGKLIEDAGLKGEKIGGAMISKKHANFIINHADAKAADIVELIELVKKIVREKFDVELEEEIGYLGF